MNSTHHWSQSSEPDHDISSMPTEPMARVYTGHVDNKGRVVYPGLNAPEVDLQALQQEENLARLGIVGNIAVPPVIDPTTLDQLHGRSE